MAPIISATSSISLPLRIAARRTKPAVSAAPRSDQRPANSGPSRWRNPFATLFSLSAVAIGGCSDRRAASPLFSDQNQQPGALAGEQQQPASRAASHRRTPASQRRSDEENKQCSGPQNFGWLEDGSYQIQTGCGRGESRLMASEVLLQ
ncbi:uncharacterized protein LOC125861376 [Solanum stenotomum]|uniref:uncharacterized protein LOC125861376 n=1 Tax=Solanum stenotomum TaxID=172797 RepID=UPI0020D14D42|nr:uncharacterized protein LOC125861376 [Solanum stenotomum]